MEKYEIVYKVSTWVRCLPDRNVKVQRVKQESIFVYSKKTAEVITKRINENFKCELLSVKEM